MRILHYALYDPQPQSGSFWTWFSPALSEELCEAVFGAYLSEHLSTPQGRANLGAKDVFGGIIRLHDKWTVVYRLLPTRRTGSNGRYDFVIITAWIETRETRGVDLSSILTSPVFQNVASKASMHPVPSPKSLTETFDGELVKTPSLDFEKKVLDFNTQTSRKVILGKNDKEVPLPQELTKSFTGDRCAIDAAAFLADVPTYRIVLIPLQPLVWVKIEKTADRNRASVEINPNAQPITIVPKPPEPEPRKQESPDTSSVDPSDRDFLSDFLFYLWQWSKKSLFTRGGCCYTVFWIFVTLIALLYGYGYGLSHNRITSGGKENKDPFEYFTELQEKEQRKLYQRLSKDFGPRAETPEPPPTKNLAPTNPDNNKIQIEVDILPTMGRCLYCGYPTMTIYEHPFGFTVDTPITGGNIVNRDGRTQRLVLECRKCSHWAEIPGREYHITVSKLPITNQDTNNAVHGNTPSRTTPTPQQRNSP